MLNLNIYSLLTEGGDHEAEVVNEATVERGAVTGGAIAVEVGTGIDDEATETAEAAGTVDETEAEIGTGIEARRGAGTEVETGVERGGEAGTEMAAEIGAGTEAGIEAEKKVGTEAGRRAGTEVGKEKYQKRMAQMGKKMEKLTVLWIVPMMVFVIRMEELMMCQLMMLRLITSING